MELRNIERTERIRAEAKKATYWKHLVFLYQEKPCQRIQQDGVQRVKEEMKHGLGRSRLA